MSLAIADKLVLTVRTPARKTKLSSTLKYPQSFLRNVSKNATIYTLLSLLTFRICRLNCFVHYAYCYALADCVLPHQWTSLYIIPTIEVFAMFERFLTSLPILPQIEQVSSLRLIAWSSKREVFLPVKHSPTSQKCALPASLKFKD